MGITDRLRHPGFAKLVELATQRLFKEWETESAAIDDGVELLRAVERIAWPPQRATPNVLDLIRGKLADEAASGCRADDLRQLLSVIDLNADADGRWHSALRQAFRVDQLDFFAEDLSDCGHSEGFKILIEGLKLFSAKLGVDASRLIFATEECMTEFEGGQEADDSYHEDELKDRWRTERSSEASISRNVSIANVGSRLMAGLDCRA